MQPMMPWIVIFVVGFCSAPAYDLGTQLFCASKIGVSLLALIKLTDWYL